MLESLWPFCARDLVQLTVGCSLPFTAFVSLVRETEVADWEGISLRGETFSPFAAEQLRSLTASMATIPATLEGDRSQQTSGTLGRGGYPRKIQKWLSGQFLKELRRCQFDFDYAAFVKLTDRRRGADGVGHQPQGLEGGTSGGRLCGAAGREGLPRFARRKLARGRVYHWTDRKIPIHAF